jgi:hypothetical protein
MGYRAIKLAMSDAPEREPVVLRVNTSVVVRDSTPQR